MRKPISIAMAASAAIHGGLFLALALLWDIESEPASIETPLVLTLDSSQAERDVAAEQAPETPAVGGEPPEPAPQAPAEPAGDPAARPAERSAKADVAPAADAGPTTSPALPARVLTEILDDIAALPEVSPVLVTTTAAADRGLVTVFRERGGRVPERVSLSPAEAAMLEARFREWSEADALATDAASAYSWEEDGREYRATFRLVPAADDMELDEVLVEITTEQDGRRLRAELRMKRLAFSNFAQFVNRWDPEVQIHDDSLDGRFHSNSRITLAYGRKVRPTFLGKVTTSSRGVRVGEGRGPLHREDIFQGGLETGVREIRLPKEFLPFPRDGRPADVAVHRFDRDTRVTFYPDGSFGWREPDSATPEERVRYAGGTLYLVAEDEARFYVQGVVRGKALVYSPRRIVIEGDLVYAHKTGRRTEADDYLGLVSDGVVEIAGRRVTGPGDLRVHASIYAKRRFAVRGYQRHGNDVLYLYGSLTAGSLTATEPRFATRIEFDRRLETLRPPAFPVTDRFEVSSWDGHWTVDETI